MSNIGIWLLENNVFDQNKKLTFMWTLFWTLSNVCSLILVVKITNETEFVGQMLSVMGFNDDIEMAEKISCEFSFEKVIAIFLLMQIVFVQMEEKIVLFLTVQKIQSKIILAIDVNL